MHQTQRHMLWYTLSTMVHHALYGYDGKVGWCIYETKWPQCTLKFLTHSLYPDSTILRFSSVLCCCLHRFLGQPTSTLLPSSPSLPRLLRSLSPLNMPPHRCAGWPVAELLATVGGGSCYHENTVGIPWLLGTQKYMEIFCLASFFTLHKFFFFWSFFYRDFRGIMDRDDVWKR